MPAALIRRTRAAAISSLKRAVPLLLLSLAGIVAACGGSAGGGSTPPAGTATAKKVPAAPTATAAPLSSPGTLTVRDIVALPPDGNFEVAFEWKKGVLTGHPGVFIWRQTGSSRRFDFFPAGARTDSGWFTLELNIAPGAATSAAVDATNCSWFGPKSGSVGVTCTSDPPTRGLADTIYAATGKQLTGTFPDRTIAGRTATCYAYDAGNAGQGAICVDRLTKVPLYLSSVEPAGQRVQEIEAISVTENVPPLSLPGGLPGDVPIPSAPTMSETALQFPASVPLTH